MHLSIDIRKVLATVFGIGLMAGVLASRAQADEWNKKTILTTNSPIQVTDTVLQPGKYVLKLMDSPSNRHVVQIFNSDQSHIIDTVLAIPNYRLQPTGKSQFAFWETPPGTVKALRAWFYPGDNFGQEFAYPKHLAMLNAGTATVSQEVAPPPAPAPAPPTTAQAEEQPEPAPAPEVAPEVAQATPPPQPEQEQAAPAPQPAPEQPQALPKTASPYPWIGLFGFIALGLGGALRLKRSV